MNGLPDLAPLGPRPAIVLHDAGAANLVIGWLADRLPAGARVHVAGPAEGLWRQRFPDAPPVADLPATLAGATGLLSGTGWASALEHQARAGWRGAQGRSIAAVDHWVNYRERFVRSGETVLPDEIWVGDSHAQAIARRDLPTVAVKQFRNVYLASHVAAVRAARARMARPERPHLLYALEPIRLPWRSSDPRPGEFQALDYLFAALDRIGLGDGCGLALRPHPSDPEGKYDAWLAAAGPRAWLDATKPLAEAIAGAVAVAGCESFVLVIAEAAGVRTISTLPPWGHRLRLPQPGIERLAALLGDDVTP